MLQFFKKQFKKLQHVAATNSSVKNRAARHVHDIKNRLVQHHLKDHREVWILERHAV